MLSMLWAPSFCEELARGSGLKKQLESQNLSPAPQKPLPRMGLGLLTL